MKSVIAQVARQEASCSIRHLRDRIIAPEVKISRESLVLASPPVLPAHVFATREDRIRAR